MTPFLSKYLGMPPDQRTLLIFGTGPHHKQTWSFMESILDLDHFARFMKRPQDIIVFRNTSPGHHGCDKVERPHYDYFSYKYSQHEILSGNKEIYELEQLFKWSMSAHFNDIATRLWYDSFKDQILRWEQDREAGSNNAFEGDFDFESSGRGISSDAAADSLIKNPSSTEGSNTVFLLDIYAMTVLRADGHISGIDNFWVSRTFDCLHYSGPGPVDWWNHLLFSNLFSHWMEKNESPPNGRSEHYVTGGGDDAQSCGTNGAKDAQGRLISEILLPK